MNNKTHYIVFIDGYTTGYRVPLCAQIFHTRDDAFFFFSALDFPSIWKIYGLDDSDYLFCGVIKVMNRDGERDIRELRGCYYTRKGALHQFLNDDPE